MSASFQYVAGDESLTLLSCSIESIFVTIPPSTLPQFLLCGGSHSQASHVLALRQQGREC